MDKEIARSFLSALVSNNINKTFCWQAISDTDDRVMRYEFVPLDLDFESAYLKMCMANTQGFCISVAHAEFKSDKRIASEVIACNFLLADIDTPISIEQAKDIISTLTPHICVQTSSHNNGYKMHMYWRLNTQDRLTIAKQFDRYQNLLANKIDAIIHAPVCDRAITIEKIMRMPSFLNHKYTTPQDVELVFIRDGTINIETLSNPTTATPPTPIQPQQPIQLPIYTPALQGARHTTMLSYIRKLFSLELPEDRIAELTLTANEQNRPPLEQEELARIYKDCREYQETSLTSPDKIRAMLTSPQIVGESIHRVSAPPPPTDFDYDYSDKKQFLEPISDRSILYRLHQYAKGRVKASQHVPTKIYNPSTGMFDEDAGEVDNMLNKIIINLPSEPLVISHFSKPAKEDEEPKVNTSALRSYIVNLRSGAHSAQLLSMVTRMKEFATKAQDWDSHLDLLNAKNGVIDLETGKLLEHNPKYMFARSLSAEYDHKAVQQYHTMEGYDDWRKSENPWVKFIWEVTDGDLEMCRFLQALLGYSLQGTLDAHILAFFHGEGCNGKSVCLEAMLKMLGGYGRSVTNNLFIENGNRSENNYYAELALLHGARFALADEIQDGTRLNEAAVKNVTTGADIVARFLHKNPFTYTPQFTSFLHGNHKPTIKGADMGIWRRIVLVPFEVSFVGRVDRNLPKKLAEQSVLNDMLAWCVAGNMRYRREGLLIPDKCREAKKRYQADMNHVLGFIDDALQLSTEHDIGVIKVGLVYGAYKYWCTENDLEPLHKNTFGRKLAEQHVISYRLDRTTRVYKARFTYKWQQIVESVGEKNLEKDNIRVAFT